MFCVRPCIFWCSNIKLRKKLLPPLCINQFGEEEDIFACFNCASLNSSASLLQWSVEWVESRALVLLVVEWFLIYNHACLLALHACLQALHTSLHRLSGGVFFVIFRFGVAKPYCSFISISLYKSILFPHVDKLEMTEVCSDKFWEQHRDMYTYWKCCVFSGSKNRHPCPLKQWWSKTYCQCFSKGRLLTNLLSLPLHVSPYFFSFWIQHKC